MVVQAVVQVRLQYSAQVLSLYTASVLFYLAGFILWNLGPYQPHPTVHTCTFPVNHYHEFLMSDQIFSNLSTIFTAFQLKLNIKFLLNLLSHYVTATPSVQITTSVPRWSP